MKTIIIYAQTNRIGSKVETEIEVEDDVEIDEIDKYARDAMYEHLIEWGWREKKKKKKE